ncbi:hypothetical protein J2W20_002350 [Sinomonas atrocyanea]|uniref:SIR2 family NAD-dependent protein deacylase n=1 Tax=Sinomonas atrocyanea TaxID=37927 RepID=UPI00278549DD|nr:SIR2 family protein [Sinomonas atrocyanea]MDQ0260446.1 hypothetical protein [Sinomonas atrocyanea]
MTTGHVFVLRADLLNLNADAWLLPTDRWVEIEPGWMSRDAGLHRRADDAAPDDFRRGDTLAFAVPTLQVGEPIPIATAVPSDNHWGPEQVRERVRAFAQAALEALPEASSRRSLRLLALPFLGSAGGSAEDLTAQMRALLEASREVAREKAVDVAVVVRDPAAYTLAQALRRDHPGEWWEELDAGIRAQAEELGRKAGLGRIVPFLGAGVSMSAGAPSWAELLADLAVPLNLSADELKELRSLNPLDQASLLETLYAERGVTTDYRSSIAERVEVPRYGLAPALLASLPSEGAITLNYDGLFEKACDDAGEPRFVIPNESGEGRWLLKLHGDAKKPKTIVLTRDDYLGFNANREALSSLVKAHLMTHHLLFVGFGLADDHFHEIVHAVHRALPEGGKRELGTAIMVAADGLHAKAWEGRLAMVRMTPDPVAKADFGVAARRLEIFLDAMMAHATQEHTYLLAEKYGESLAAHDRELREDLLTLVAKHGGSDSPAWAVVKTALEGLGLPARILEQPLVPVR